MGKLKRMAFFLSSKRLSMILAFILLSFSRVSVSKAQVNPATCLQALSSATDVSLLNLKWREFLERVSGLAKYRIEGEIATQFGSSIKNEDGDQHRLAIRNRLSQLMEFQRDIFDLQTIPKPNRGSVSIAHTEGLGGFISSSKVPLGFDVERASHLESVKTGVLERVLTLDELDLPVPRKYLWSLKEAGLKSLNGQGPKDARQIEIFKTAILEDGIIHAWGEYVDTFHLVEFEGWALQIDDYIFAITLRR